MLAAAQKAAELGAVKNVIHTAGLSPVLVEKLGAEEGRRTIVKVNALGAVHMTDAFYPVLEEGGSMVLFTSSAAYLMPAVPESMQQIFFSVKDEPEQLFDRLLTIAPDPGRAYMFSKLFVMFYVRMNAGRFGHKGCRINSIAPGRIVTPMHQTLIDREPERIAGEMATMPLGRYGAAYEIGNLIDFLCSYRASYINGIDILMDEGTQAFTSVPAAAGLKGAYMDLLDVFGLKGKNVLVTGAGSGMGKAAARLLTELGANVYATVRRKPVDFAVTKQIPCDLGSQAGVDTMLAQTPDELDAIYICHGISNTQGNRNAMQVQLTNFYSFKYITEQLLPRIADNGSVTFISSDGGKAWRENIAGLP